MTVHQSQCTLKMNKIVILYIKHMGQLTVVEVEVVVVEEVVEMPGPSGGRGSWYSW